MTLLIFLLIFNTSDTIRDTTNKAQLSIAMTSLAVGVYAYSHTLPVTVRGEDYNQGMRVFNIITAVTLTGAATVAILYIKEKRKKKK